ncbi:mycofactocin-coupled SDR family oxidoreductase [Mycobacterium sp. WUMAC-067]|uniref:mycofactocin-coupled SDR family oxidoreductase n=1 Tax=unclassified Mycobacterium TaxID=2642494 RepID=UPI001CD94545|nr:MULTISPECIES: mycofactocin-coupled SDR family oxidoreductase [unclassified Mycobacterium]MCA2244785.1 mycofactocin-coupled SDR family oxidoreductase [Mycobacterium sp. WUMAC-067]MCA2315995.1 mycofactocin-coupled SDR family oxidoreductase [Mycobacterium sp. WUMAC-025]
MTNQLEDKVAFITGAARGQGRAHAIQMAAQGADIIAIDICAQIESNKYPLSSVEDLKTTAKLVENLGRRCIAVKADVRERGELRTALDEAITELGHLDIVVANAGILPMAMGHPQPSDFVDATDVDLLGVLNTIAVSLPHISDGGSIIVTGSTAGLMPATTTNSLMGPGGAGYAWAKNTLVGYVEQMAVHLAPRLIRVNAIHPTNCNTDLLHNDGLYAVFRPDMKKDKPSRADAELAFTHFQAMPIPYVEPEDIANLAVFLASDESRYVTGQQIRVDAGALLKFPNGPAG